MNGLSIRQTFHLYDILFRFYHNRWLRYTIRIRIRTTGPCVHCHNELSKASTTQPVLTRPRSQADQRRYIRTFPCHSRHNDKAELWTSTGYGLCFDNSSQHSSLSLCHSYVNWLGGHAQHEREHASTYTHVHRHGHKCAYERIYTYARSHARTHARTHTNTHTHTHTHTHRRKYTRTALWRAGV